MVTLFGLACWGGLHADDPTDREAFQEIPESQVQDLLSYLAPLDDD